MWTFSTGITSADESYRYCAFGSVACTDAIGEAAKVLLRALALLPDEGAAVSEYEGDRVTFTNAKSECHVFRGGSFSVTNNGGVFSINGVYSRSYSGMSTGFRSAYIPTI